MFAEIRHLKLAVWIILLLSGTLRLSAGHFVPAYIGNGYNHMYFVILDARIGEIYYQSGDEIAIYDDTVCCGIGTLTSEIKYEESIYLMITASAYSGLGEADGFSEGHPVQIRCWSRVAQREDVATLTFLDRNTGVPLVSAPVFESSSTVFVKLQVDNHAPVADAGESRTVEEGEVVTLDGRGSSDADGDVLTYRWIAPAGIVLSSSVAVQPTFTAPAVDQSTDYTFTLIVSDGITDSAPSAVSITVMPAASVNHAPVADAGESRTVEEGEVVTLDGRGSSDADGDALTYRWIAPGGIVLSSSVAVQPAFTAPAVDQSTDYTFTLIVSDGITDSAPSAVSITVMPAASVNHAPVADAGESRTVEEGEVVTLDGRGSSDADGDALTYRWIAPAGIVLSSSVAVQPTFTAPAVDQSTDYTFTLIVSDGNQESDASQVTIFVKDIISFSEVVREERTVEAYPNPFLGEVNIGIQGEERDIFVIRIYNSSGICINRRTLDTHSDGRVVYIWNGTTESGDKVSPGLYYCVIYTKEGMKKSVTRIIKK